MQPKRPGHLPFWSARDFSPVADTTRNKLGSFRDVWHVGGLLVFHAPPVKQGSGGERPVAVKEPFSQHLGHWLQIKQAISRLFMRQPQQRHTDDEVNFAFGQFDL